MTNYDKKRKRQRGRQGVGSESERERIYRQGYWDGKHVLINHLSKQVYCRPLLLI